MPYAAAGVTLGAMWDRVRRLLHLQPLPEDLRRALDGGYRVSPPAWDTATGRGQQPAGRDESQVSRSITAE